MATLLLNRGQINLVKNVVKPLYFYLDGKTDRKYEISISELTSRPNFSLIPLKIKKLDFDPKTKNDVITVMTSTILLWFWIEFVTYFHTSRFGFD